jgi:Domain of unknown function (DUF3291)
LTAAGHHLAIYNFGVHVESYSTASVQGFALREPFNFEAAARAVGFVGRSGYDDEPGPESWGDHVIPHSLGDFGGRSTVSSLSLWEDIESLSAFSYTGVHADALKHARQWNVKQDWPPLVLFWLPAGERPSWSDGVERFERLMRYGPAPAHFTFKNAFSPEGEPYQLDRGRVKQLTAANLDLQRDLLEIVTTLPV